MPKKSKTPKETNTSAGTALNEDSKKATYEELIAQDPEFHRGSSRFKFPNGDEYDGEFCAHASGLIWRQGKGTYITNDGQIYVGYWDGDKLDETKDVEITYPDGTKYYGNLFKNKYSGSGIYQLEEKVSLMCNFVENKPSGDITLIDPNEKAWHGLAETDESLLIPEHAFYRVISKDLGKGRPKRVIEKSVSIASLKDSQKSDTGSSKGPKYSDLRDVEKQIFAKTKKTSSDLQFENSEWFQDYVTYKDTYGPIIRKAKTTGETSLTADEYDWYIHYKEFEKKYTTLLNNYKNKSKKGPALDNKLFEILHSKEYRIKNKQIPVFYPREESEDDCDSNCECEL